VSFAKQLGRMSADLETKGRATSFLRYGIALASARGERKMAEQICRTRWPNSTELDRVARIRKSAVSAGSTTDSTWAAPLAEQQPLASAFIEMLRSRTVLDQMMPAMRRVPFNVMFPRVTGGASARWVGQREVKPVSAMALETVHFTFSKIATTLVLSQELIKNSDPAAELVLRNDMTHAIVAFMDVSFLDPTVAAVADQSPASITNGATEITASGTTATAIAADLHRLFAAITTKLVAPYLVMKPSTAVWLASLDAGKSFPKVGAAGGEIWGVPVITSGNTPSDANSPTEGIIILVDAAEIMVADGEHDDDFALAAQPHCDWCGAFHSLAAPARRRGRVSVGAAALSFEPAAFGR
jgi:HK97 family phage major capsid protein